MSKPMIFLSPCAGTSWITDILRGGKRQSRWDDGTPAHTIKKFAVINRYDLSEEFPILTLREINLKAAIDELLWIWQKKSNNIRDLNSRIWTAGRIRKALSARLTVISWASSTGTRRENLTRWTERSTI